MADDHTYDYWEDLADSKDLDKTLEKKSEGSKKKKQVNPTNLMDSQFTGGEKSGVGGQIKILQRPPVIIDENNTRTPPVSAPQMKILKRPEKSREELEKNEKKVCQQPLKTYAQREAEYNKARQRIMGSTGQESGTSTSAEQPLKSNDVRNNTDSGAAKHGRYTNKNKNNHHHHTAATNPNNHHHHHHPPPPHITGVAGSNGMIGGVPSGVAGYEPRRNNYYHKNSNGKGSYGR